MFVGEALPGARPSLHPSEPSHTLAPSFRKVSLVLASRPCFASRCWLLCSLGSAPVAASGGCVSSACRPLAPVKALPARLGISRRRSGGSAGRAAPPSAACLSPCAQGFLLAPAVPEREVSDPSSPALLRRLQRSVTWGRGLVQFRPRSMRVFLGQERNPPYDSALGIWLAAEEGNLPPASGLGPTAADHTCKARTQPCA